MPGNMYVTSYTRSCASTCVNTCTYARTHTPFVELEKWVSRPQPAQYPWDTTEKHDAYSVPTHLLLKATFPPHVPAPLSLSADTLLPAVTWLTRD